MYGKLSSPLLFFTLPFILETFHQTLVCECVFIDVYNGSFGGCVAFKRKIVRHNTVIEIQYNNKSFEIIIRIYIRYVPTGDQIFVNTHWSWSYWHNGYPVYFDIPNVSTIDIRTSYTERSMVPSIPSYFDTTVIDVVDTVQYGIIVVYSRQNS